MYFPTPLPVSGGRGGGDCVLQHKCEWVEALEVSWGEGVDLEHVKQQWAAAMSSMDGRWIKVNKTYRAVISNYSAGFADLEFESFNGEADRDNGTYNLLEAEIDWEFSSAPK